MAKKSAPQYKEFDSFLRAAIRAYWESGDASKVSFLALLIASGETWQVAWEGAKAPGSGKKILTGAAGAAAIALLLRTLVGGPIGILLTGASIASLVALYVKNHQRIWRRVDRYRDLIAEYRTKFEEVRDDYVDGSIRHDQRDLMVDGLMSRFLVALDEHVDEDEADDSAEDDDATLADADASDASEGHKRSTFADHAERRRQREERDKRAQVAPSGEDDDAAS